LFAFLLFIKSLLQEHLLCFIDLRWYIHASFCVSQTTNNKTSINLHLVQAFKNLSLSSLLLLYFLLLSGWLIIISFLCLFTMSSLVISAADLYTPKICYASVCVITGSNPTPLSKLFYCFPVASYYYAAIRDISLISR